MPGTEEYITRLVRAILKADSETGKTEAAGRSAEKAADEKRPNPFAQELKEYGVSVEPLDGAAAEKAGDMDPMAEVRFFEEHGFLNPKTFPRRKT
jgi:hypothetical protein